MPFQEIPEEEGLDISAIFGDSSAAPQGDPFAPPAAVQSFPQSPAPVMPEVTPAVTATSQPATAPIGNGPSKALGFEVYWDGDAKCVQVESKKPYTGEAPVTSAEAKPVEQPAQTDVAAAKQDIIDRTNALRKENGVAVLRVNDRLMQAAQVRADEMAASGVYSHTRPDGRKSNTVTDSKYTGENLHNISELYLEQQHKTLSEAVVELWSNSKAHADNMTSSRYGEIGVGLARGIDKDGFDCWYCVQVFLLDGCEVTWVDTTAMK